jgi:hypothetical protein
MQCEWHQTLALKLELLNSIRHTTYVETSSTAVLLRIPMSAEAAHGFSAIEQQTGGRVLQTNTAHDTLLFGKH